MKPQWQQQQQQHQEQMRRQQELTQEQFKRMHQQQEQAQEQMHQQQERLQKQMHDGQEQLRHMQESAVHQQELARQQHERQQFQQGNLAGLGARPRKTISQTWGAAGAPTPRAAVPKPLKIAQPAGAVQVRQPAPQPYRMAAIPEPRPRRFLAFLVTVLGAALSLAAAGVVGGGQLMQIGVLVAGLLITLYLARKVWRSSLD